MSAGRSKLLAATLALGAIAAGPLAGCGSDDEASTDTVVQSVTETTAAPTNTGGETTAPLPPVTTGKPPTGGKNTVPNLVGQTVGEAQTALGKLSLAGRAENKSGGSRTDIKIDWIVCQTVPKAGVKLPTGSPITLLSAESC